MLGARWVWFFSSWASEAAWAFQQLWCIVWEATSIALPVPVGETVAAARSAGEILFLSNIVEVVKLNCCGALLLVGSQSC